MKSEIIATFEKLHLKPLPDKSPDGRWTAICPNGSDHRLTIDEQYESWKCSECNDQGSWADIIIVEWLARHKALANDQCSLSKFHKAINGKQPLTNEMMSWWMSRY
jgi:hypothetical protein